MGAVLKQLDSNHRDCRVVKDYSWQGWTAWAGTIVNGASIPRFLWPIFGGPFTGRHRNAAVLHDAYYHKHHGKTRKQVDAMFYRKMRDDGVNYIKAKAMYYGVRVGGRKAWKGE